MLLNISTRRNVAIDLVARGLVTQAEASKLIGEGRQAFAYMARNVDAIAARAQYVDELWREEIAKLKKKAQEENKAMRRRGNSMAGLSQNARAWLRGDKSCCVFFRGKPADELEELWQQAHGDSDSMYWKRGMRLPISHEALEEHENDSLESGEYT
jgi:hypothetical protein